MTRTTDDVIADMDHKIAVYTNFDELSQAPICIDLSMDGLSVTRWLSEEAAVHLWRRLGTILKDRRELEAVGVSVAAPIIPAVASVAPSVPAPFAGQI